jgi:hypothetical protein
MTRMSARPATDPTRPPPLAVPPWTLAEGGHARRVGIEIEYDGVDVGRTGALLTRLFGGRLDWHDPYRAVAADTELGDFEIELDMSLAHPDAPAKARADTDPHAEQSWDVWAKEELDRFFERLEADLAEAVGDVGSLWMPVEIGAPPIAWDRLGEIDRLVQVLREAGAGGTRSGLLSAYGTQLNPEVACADPGHLLAVLRAYLLLSEWLREEIGVDLRRRITPFVDPFPNSYMELTLDPDYAPDRRTLIADYLSYNPTRNRELDLLPLFAHLDMGLVRSRLPRTKIHPRPTFHYRLPDTRLDRSDWSIALEWNRWVAVERLAADAERLSAGMARYREHRAQLIPYGWSAHARELAEGLYEGPHPLHRHPDPGADPA